MATHARYAFILIEHTERSFSLPLQRAGVITHLIVEHIVHAGTAIQEHSRNPNSHKSLVVFVLGIYMSANAKTRPEKKNGFLFP